MNARTTALILREIRQAARMSDSGPGQGLDDDFILAKLADHITLFQSRVSAATPNVFRRVSPLQLVAGQNTYPIPVSVLNGGEIVQVLKRDSLGVYPLVNVTSFEQDQVNTSGIFVYGYRVIENSIRIHPTPSFNETLSLEFNLRYPALDKPRGTVSSTATTGSNFTEIVVTAPDALLASALQVSIVDEVGTILYPGVSCSSWDAANSKLILDSGTNPTTGGTIPVGATICVGSYSTTRAPRTMTDAVLAYLKESVAGHLSRIDGRSTKQTDLLQQMFSAATDSLLNQVVDIQPLPIYEDNYDGL